MVVGESSYKSERRTSACIHGHVATASIAAFDDAKRRKFPRATTCMYERPGYHCTHSAALPRMLSSPVQWLAVDSIVPATRLGLFLPPSPSYACNARTSAATHAFPPLKHHKHTNLKPRISGGQLFFPRPEREFIGVMSN